jgi:hypothetical protein
MGSVVHRSPKVIHRAIPVNLSPWLKESRPITDTATKFRVTEAWGHGPEHRSLLQHPGGTAPGFD